MHACVMPPIDMPSAFEYPSSKRYLSFVHACAVMGHQQDTMVARQLCDKHNEQGSQAIA